MQHRLASKLQQQLAVHGLVAPQIRRVSETGEVFLLTVGAFLLTAKLLCLQSLEALIMGD